MKILEREELTFDEEQHQYSLGDVEFISATQFLGQFFSKFDPDAIVDKYYDKWQENPGKKPEYYGKTKDEIKEMWVLNAQQRSQHGTDVHNAIEDYIKHCLSEESIELFSDPETRAKALQGVKYWKIIDTLYKPKLVLPEKRIYSLEHGIAGTIDLLLVDSNGEAMLFDWKTNHSIDNKGFMGQKAKYPISDLDDCNYEKYRLQLSLYAYILETEYDLPIKGLTLVHLTETKSNQIPMEYSKAYILSLLQYWYDKRTTSKPCN